MHSSPSPFQPLREGPDRRGRGSIQEAVGECITRTAEALRSTGAASEHEIAAALTAAHEAMVEDTPYELIEGVARAQGHQEEYLSGAILTLSAAVASTLSPSPPLIPFAAKLIAPSAFYESFEAIHQLGRALVAPVIYAEDTDAIGTASINPIAALILAEEILAAVDRRFGIKPFLTVARMDYENWAFLSRKHFGL